MTTLLGFGLGAIMVYRRSIWDAVFAHGFFNAGSFFLLYLLATRAPQFITGG
jgi:membrane protease YdiL (CAAX protease family)